MKGMNTMKLGAFSISLAVKDIVVSKEFYMKLGFEIFGGDETQNWLIMKNGDHIVGLFQGMFEKNCLTFNPGWNQNSGELDAFSDVRELLTSFKNQGLEVIGERIESTTGPASFTVIDPDGNPILIDQHR